MRIYLYGERKRAGLTQEELSAKANMERTRYSRIEQGKANPTLKEGLAIAKVLKVKTMSALEQIFLTDNVHQMRKKIKTA